MAENTSKNAKKIVKNRANPHGTGVMRFEVAKTISSSSAPITITQILVQVQKEYPTVTRQWVYTVITELLQTGINGCPLKSCERRAGRTKCPAYYITTNQN